MLSKGCYRNSIVLAWTGENDSNTLHVDAYFFENGEKKISVFKNIWMRVDRASVKRESESCHCKYESFEILRYK